MVRERRLAIRWTAESAENGNKPQYNPDPYTNCDTFMNPVYSVDVRGLGDVVNRSDWLGKRIAVLGDVHGNAHAFEAVLNAVELAGIERVVFHGDLLTYGFHPHRCAKLLDELPTRFDAVILAGNHEPFYFEGQAGNDALFAHKLDFVVASIRWTLRALEHAPLLQERYPWRDAVVIGPVLVSHANPFDRPNWRYLNSEQDERDACARLQERGATIGVFGHTHRSRITSVQGENWTRHHTENPVALGPDTLWSLNTGSVGQPRGEGSSWLELDLRQTPILATVHRAKYEKEAHLAAVRASGLELAYIKRLCSYFER